MIRIIVSLKNRTYPIIIEKNFENYKNIFHPLKNGDKSIIITNDYVSKLHLPHLVNTLMKLGIISENIILPDGEKYKSLETLNKIFTFLLKNNYGRNVILIAFGGGVIGDLTGFAASCYQRGVRFIQIPTTLLSQVDASIGGKTAVNHILGKNMIGAFYQPSSVIINLHYLKTLSKRQFISGLAEVIKYGIILDSNFFLWLEENINNLLSLDNESLSYCISNCCKLKADIIISDEREKKLRTLLNLGHTYGHAIEAYMGYGNWLHGEAIAVGIMMAIKTSCIINKFSDNDAERVKELFLRAGLPIKGPENMMPDDYLTYMLRDKKTNDGKLSLVLPITIGKAKLFTEISKNIVRSVINNCT